MATESSVIEGDVARDVEKIKEEAERILREAMNEYTKGNYDKATPLFRESLRKYISVCSKTDPKLARGYYNLGLCLSRIKDHRNAIKSLKVSLTLKKNYTNPKPKKEDIENIEKALYQQLFNQGVEHKDLKQYAEALSCFSLALTFEPIDQKKLKENIEDIIKLLKKSYAEIQSDRTYSEKIFRPILCKPEYLKEIESLAKESDNARNFGFTKQVELIIKLIDFMKFYGENSCSSTFMKPELLEKSDEGIRLRLHEIGNEIIKGASHALSLDYLKSRDTFLSLMEDVSWKTINVVRNDIYFEDAKRILRMIFETIHKFPRGKRGELIRCLPWTENSWYLLEFCGAIFASDDTVDKGNQQGGIYLPVYSFKGDLQKQKQLALYHTSLRQHTLIVKISILDIIRKDVPILKEFFCEVLKNEDTSKIKMRELPNLKTLLWYTKQTYNAHRLLCLLPAVPTTPADSKAIEGTGANQQLNINEPIDIVEYFKTRELKKGLEGRRDFFISLLKSISERSNSPVTVGDLIKYGWITPSEISYGADEDASCTADFIV